MAKRMRARYADECVECGLKIARGEHIVWEGRGRVFHDACHNGATSADPEVRRDHADYLRGVADAKNYSANVRLFGRELAERWEMERELREGDW